MIYVCPYCGNSLTQPLSDGICICTNCKALFDSSPQSRLLSAAWIARKKNMTMEKLVGKFGLSCDEAEIIEDKVLVGGYTHDEFLKFLNEEKVPNRCYM
jgi:hypothetical protein